MLVVFAAGDLVLEVERLKEDLVSRGALVEWSGGIFLGFGFPVAY